MTVPFPEPTTPASSRAEVFTRYLDYFRDRLAAKLRGLPERELRRSRLMSGWTPLELLKHLTFVELRWLEWGFEGRDVGDPWGDRRGDRWYVAPDETLTELLAAARAQAARSTAIIAAHGLDEVGQPSERWAGAAPPTLETIAGHLRAADGFVVVSGEYNHSIPPALSNLLDYFLEEWFWRPSAIVCYSGGPWGGVRAAMQLRAMLAELGMPSIPSLLPVPKVQDAFDDAGVPRDPRTESRAVRFFDELEWYARALASGRAGGTPY